MKRIIFTLLVQAATILVVYASEIPSEIEFAGMKLELTDAVKKKLQADIDMITRGQKAFQTKVDRADLYFPIIERIFKEEDLPDDFKYLALQESSLVSDAVSTSNAVGYWQFKKETAVEVGLRVDFEIDERMNIVSSSRGAAKYLKKNNTVYFNNWIYTLLSYNLGAGGTKTKVKDKYIGSKKMVIDDDMHWYVIRFLAHKLAYQQFVGKNYSAPTILIAYDNCENKSLQELSQETKVDIQNIEMYNKWVLKGKVPNDKDYCAILPVSPTDQNLIAKNDVKTKSEGKEEKNRNKNEESGIRIKIERRERKKRESELSGTGDVALTISINGIRAIKSKEGDTPDKLALKGGISVFDFLKYNDLKSFEQIKPGECYYLQPKRSKGIVFFHTVQPGESLNEISQKNGIRIESIRKKNRMGKNENPQVGRVLWLRKKRPESTPVEVKKVEVIAPVTHETVVQPVKSDSVKTINPAVEYIEPMKKDTVVNNGLTHTVKPGETLYGISRMYQLSVDSLKAMNNLSTNEIKLGQVLSIQREKSTIKTPNVQMIEHTVQQGETLYSISKKYNVTVVEIQSWNNKLDSKVSLGEKLLIKKPIGH